MQRNIEMVPVVATYTKSDEAEKALEVATPDQKQLKKYLHS